MDVDVSTRTHRLLRATRSTGAVGRGDGRDGGPVPRARRPGARAHRQRARDERRARVRVPPRRAAPALPADRLAPPEEARGRRPAAPRAARSVGVLLARTRGARASRHRRRHHARRFAMSTRPDELREQVRRRYAESARAAAVGGLGGCGGGSCCTDDAGAFGAGLYGDDARAELPEGARRASLGCGVPTEVADLREGEVVLDLGSGGGIDVILSARRVGPTGLALGLDMTDEMLALAQANAREAGVRNVIFLKGVIESIPLPAASVDVVIS